MLQNLKNARLFVFALLFLLPPVANSQTGLTKLSAPTEQKVAGADKAFCVQFDNKNRFCKVLADGDSSFFIESDERQIAGWTTAAFLGDISQFEVWRVDLDGDRREEIVISNFDGQSNGMGVNYRTLYILPSDWKTSDASRIDPLRFSAEDFSVAGGFIKNNKINRFDILVSNWESDWQAKGKKSGLYLVGRWFNYKNGSLIPSEKSLVVRRYSRQFEKERLATLENGKIPAVWIKPTNSETRKTDLMNTSETATILNGTIEKINPFPSLTLEIKTSDGKNQTIEYSNENYDSSASRFSFFGDWRTRRIFPKNYLPENLTEELKGKRIRLVRYRTGSENDFNVLWLFGNK